AAIQIQENIQTAQEKHLQASGHHVNLQQGQIQAGNAYCLEQLVAKGKDQQGDHRLNLENVVETRPSAAYHFVAHLADMRQGSATAHRRVITVIAIGKICFEPQQKHSHTGNDA